MKYRFSIRKIYNDAAELLLDYDYDENGLFVAAELEMLLMLIIYADYIEDSSAKIETFKEVEDTMRSIIEHYVYVDEDEELGIDIVESKDTPRQITGFNSQEEIDQYIDNAIINMYDKMYDSDILNSVGFQRLAKRMHDIIFDYTDNKIYDTDSAVINHTSRNIMIDMKI